MAAATVGAVKRYCSRLRISITTRLWVSRKDSLGDHGDASGLEEGGNLGQGAVVAGQYGDVAQR